MNKKEQLEFETLQELLKQFELSLAQSETIRFTEDEFESIIHYYLQNNQAQFALDASEMALILYPFSSEFCLTKADAHIELGELDHAEEYLTHNFKIDKTDIDFYIILSEVHVLRNNYNKAIEICKEGLEICRENLDELYLHLAEIYDHQGEYEEVIPNIEEAIRLNPLNEDALYLYSITMSILDKVDEKIVFLQSLINEDPFNDEAWYFIAISYRELGMYEKAIEALEYINAIDEEINVLGDMAQIHYEAGDYTKALDCLKELETEEELESIDYQTMAKCYRELGNLHKAKVFFKEALSIDESNDDLYYELANVYYTEGKYQAALSLINKACDKNKELAHYLELKADILIAMDKLDEACELYKNIILLNHSTSYYICKFAYIAALKFGLEDALELIDKGIEDNQHPSLHYHKAVLYFIFEKEELGFKAFAKGLEHDFPSHTILFEKLPEMAKSRVIIGLISDFKN
jgi:tetratricopeptide (TPR) repeat protein